jgi:hypothetical protein
MRHRYSRVPDQPGRALVSDCSGAWTRLAESSPVALIACEWRAMAQLGRSAGVPSTAGVGATQPTVGGIAGCGIEASFDCVLCAIGIAC